MPLKRRFGDSPRPEITIHCPLGPNRAMTTTRDVTTLPLRQSNSPSETVRPWPRWLWFVLLVVLLFAFLRANKRDEDVRFWAYVTGCAHAGDWHGVYDKENHPFAFAPYGYLSMTVLLYPLGYLPQPAMRIVMIFTIFGMWYALYRLMAAGVADRRQGFRGWVPLATAGPILGMLLAGRYLLNDLNLKQLNMITFTCGCLGLWLMMVTNVGRPQCGKGLGLRGLFGAGLLAFSIGFKLFTLPLMAMLVIKRAWREAVAVGILTVGFVWLLPRLAMGPEVYAELSQLTNSSTANMWLQVKDTTQTWSFLNFLHYRIYIAPLWSGLAELPPRAYQLICAAATFLIGLPTLHVLLRCRWRDMNAARLWEEIAMIGVAWALIDPDGRTAHYVTLVPAFCLIVTRRLEAWHQAGERPRLWEGTVFLVIGLTNLWMIRLPEPLAHHWYMNFGLFSLGMFALYGMTYHEIRRTRRRASPQRQPSLPTTAALAAA